MVRTFRIPVAMAVLAALLALVGCGGSKPAAPAPAPAAPPAAAPAPAPKPPLTFGVVTSRTGAFEAWGTDMLRGFEIGLDYATDGKREVGGRKINLVVKDDQGKPDVGKQMAIEAFEKDKADVLFGTVSSGVALQILPLLEQYKKVMVVEPAASDAITTTNFTRYAFRTGSNTGQDALTGAAGAAKLGKKVLQLAPDYDWGKTSAGAWRAVMEKNGLGKGDIEEMFIDQNATDFVPFLKQIQAKAPEVLVLHWSNAATAPKLNQQIVQLGLLKQMKLATGIGDMRSMKAMTADNVGTGGLVKYFYTFPKTRANDFLVAEYKKRFNETPELFTAGGMAAAIAIVDALKKTSGDADAEKLIATLEGMSFDGPKGQYTFRKEDHQALQPMYVAKLEMNPGFPHPTPTLVAELSPEGTAPPVQVKK